METNVVDSSNDLDLLLEEYKGNFTETQTENESIKQTESANEQSARNIHAETGESSSTPENVWRNNPLYYQTGKKAGQLRKLAAKKDNEQPLAQSMEISGTLIDGALFIMLIDLLFPLLITFVNNKVSDAKIKVEDLQLTEKQKKDLTPISDEVVKHLTLKANPIWLMVIAMSGIYGINYMAAKSAADAKLER